MLVEYLFLDVQSYLESLVLRSGDVILPTYGGHGISLLEGAGIIEVQKGHYVAGNNGKIRLEGFGRDGE